MKLFRMLKIVLGTVFVTGALHAQETPVSKELLSKFEIGQVIVKENLAHFTYKGNPEISDVKLLVSVNNEGFPLAFEMELNEETGVHKTVQGLVCKEQKFNAAISYKVKELNKVFTRFFVVDGFLTEKFSTKTITSVAADGETTFDSYKSAFGTVTASTGTQTSSGTSQIQAYAQQRANQMASSGFKGHLPGAVVTFGGVTYYEGTGWNSKLGIMPNTCRGSGAPSAEASANGSDGSYGVRFYTTPTRPSRGR